MVTIAHVVHSHESPASVGVKLSHLYQVVDVFLIKFGLKIRYFLMQFCCFLSIRIIFSQLFRFIQSQRFRSLAAT
jgi:hypothetical protein